MFEHLEGNSIKNSHGIQNALRLELVKLHENLLNCERDLFKNQSPLSDNNVNESFQKITTAARRYEHYDCFSFAQAVMASAGYNVPTFSISDCTDTRRNMREFDLLYPRPVFDNLENWHMNEAFRLNAIGQGVLLTKDTAVQKCVEVCSSQDIDFTSRYLFLMHNKYPVHGMLILGPNSSGDDLWILHRNDTASLASVELLSTIEHRWDNLYNSSGDRFIVKLDLTISPPIDSIEPIPHPEQSLLDLALAYRKLISTDLSDEQIANSVLGIKELFSVCAKALISQGTFTEQEILSALEDTGNAKYKSHFEHSLNEKPPVWKKDRS
jgi:hypothetical protein